MKKILITGGAGFVGSSLAIWLREHRAETEVIAFDNLRRRGSELAVTRLQSHGVKFQHGDVRVKSDLQELGGIDLIIDCSAEASILSGVTDSVQRVFDTNLSGTFNCLEVARQNNAALIFLSTSRVYPVAGLNGLPLNEVAKRYELKPEHVGVGVSSRGIGEDFPLAGARSLYGMSKLASELLIEEYHASFSVRFIVNRCGVLAGPWQMGKVDQGFMAQWVASHHFGKNLTYIGYGGTGKQLRDVLHVTDLCELVSYQIDNLTELDGETFNVGGGMGNTVSLTELTEFCQKETGKKIQILREPATRPNDIRWYVTDNRKVQAKCNWQPQRNIQNVVQDIAVWILDNEAALRSVFN